jgi:hypothetical protein
LESDRHPASFFNKASAADIEEVMEQLIFRVFNRIPFDTVVTSIQGKYITLSGGLAQNIKQGDNLEFFRTSVSALHPANGTWYAFSQKKLGSALVVESKQNTSVAKVTTLAYENALQIGDGAKVPQITSRKKFAASGTPDVSESKDPVELAPMYDKDGNKLKRNDEEWDTGESEDPPPEAPPVPQTTPAPVEAATETIAPPPEVAPPQEAAEEEEGESEAAEETESKQPGPLARWISSLTLKGADVKAWGGLDLWSAKGSASASAKLPLWIFNRFGVKAEKEFTSTLGYGYGATLGYGPTKGGSFFGFGLNTDMNYRMQMKNIWSDAQALRFGARASFDSYAVKSESFGGGDYLLMSAYTRLDGSTKIQNFSTPISWQTELELPLMPMGKMGSSGKSRTISSVSGYKLGFGASMEEPKGEKLGAEFALTSQSYELSKGSISLDGIYLGIFAVYPF